MKLKKMAPIVTLSKFDGIKEFYRKHFGFKVTFEANEFLSMVSAFSNEIEISFMKPDNAQQPEFSSQGLTYAFEVDDVDAEYDRLKNEAVSFLQPIQDNPWGDRSFIVNAPAGIALYIYKPIPPQEEYKDYFKS